MMDWRMVSFRIWICDFESPSGPATSGSGVGPPPAGRLPESRKSLERRLSETLDWVSQNQTVQNVLAESSPRGGRGRTTRGNQAVERVRLLNPDSRIPLMCFRRQRFAIVAAILCLGSALGGRADAGAVLQTPAGLNPGDQFRFVFVTGGIRDATSTNIADYDSFVNAQAGGATYGGATVNWLAIGSTDSVDAIDHVGQTNTPVYLSDGTLVTPDTTLAGLWSGALNHQINLDVAGNPVSSLNFVWTGTNPTGTGFGGPLGTLRPQVGSSTDTGGAWVSSGSSPSGDLRNFYGISSVLTVPTSAPEPSSLTMLGMVALAIAVGRVRHRRGSQRAGAQVR